MSHDEDELRALFDQVPVPPGVGAWRDRIPEQRRRRPYAVVAAVAVTVVTAVPAAALLLREPDPAPPPPAVRTTTPPPAVTTSKQTGATTPTPRPATASPSTRPTTPVTPVKPATTSPTPRPAPSSRPAPALRLHRGDLVITTANATVSDVQVSGTIHVQASNVTLDRVKVVAPGQYFGIRQHPGARNLTVRSCDIGGAEYGIRQEETGLTVSGCDIHDVRIGLALGHQARATGNRIHTLASPSSSYGVYGSPGSTGITLTGNTISNQHDGGAAVMLDTDGGPQRDILLQRNRLSGGQYTLYAGAAAGSRDIRVIGNRLGRGSAGHLRSWDASLPGSAWRDNVLH